MKWRAQLRALHRDLGYLIAGLTIAYAISGLAVNHVDDWNPSYQITQAPISVGPLPSKTDLDAMERHAAAALHLDKTEIKGRLHSRVDEFTLFLQQGGEVKVRISTGVGKMKRVTSRAALFEFNVLHLNHIKGLWTWVADAFALILIFLAISGLLMNKGRVGLAGRGKWWTGAGLVIPLVAIWAYYSSLG
ncbi:MAG: PepSY-associated TM helix domain-containing protein [Myxococcales bacterium]|nr:PepSY-associated TM helix domain-containing protein [Myxococcales bacterium]